ncbi:ParB N-terminal domain-containing protein [Crocosphaera chwakensis]|uniref:ParB/Sulfiredoxin domain-containing protein n=1 Tax=Crocosphaera chwakensis CCY0110 TaxID=391612 RepID=A3ILY5_9CHRO|nr:chromosome partitioning protein ParB [Crocosphaera chwakensis]EAZ92441.1 hypothetical protein CY0110_01909 [Crocosphaera chwakensis CCY0110]
MNFFLVDIDTIANNIPLSEDNESSVQRLADAILESECLINPLVVKRLGVDSYELVYGEIEYYAAVKASKIDPRKGEMVGVFILENEKEDSIKTQVNILRKSLSNGGKNHQTVCKASDNYNKLNSVQKDINQIHEKLESLMELNTAKGLRDLLGKQINSIISESENKSKEEAIKYLRTSKAELLAQQNKIDAQILELSKVNLADTSYEQLSTLMKQAGSKSNQIKASWKAVEYWRKSDQELTWENLKKSTVKSKEKIKGFANASYQVLKKVAYL